MEQAEELFERGELLGTSMGPKGARALTLLQFSLQLLSSRNDAMCEEIMTASTFRQGQPSHDQPLTHYWTSCSHNSYIVGDQLTGFSSANVYRRLLLQHCRSLEIDCWDLRDVRTTWRANAPVVTHGHTFVTIETFEAVANAIAVCAFTSSRLPVVLSLEMHCSPMQQRCIAHYLCLYLGKMLIRFDEFERGWSDTPLSPSDLQMRILVKGKVKQSQRKANASSFELFRRTSSVHTSGRLDGSIACTSTRGRLSSLSSLMGRRSSLSSHMGRRSSLSSLSRASCSLRRKHPTSSPGLLQGSSLSPTSSSGQRSSLNRLSSAKPATDMKAGLAVGNTVQYSTKASTERTLALVISLRTCPVDNLFAESGPWPLTFSSVNEDRLLKQYGLSKAERNEIEGLVGESVGPSKRTQQAAVGLSYDPPAAVAEVQRVTRKALLRPYPLGLRFSGANMNPLPCWLGGAQHVALNMSNNDLPLQLHYALFNKTDGYQLKPREMREELAALEQAWPPPRDSLSCITCAVLSLHNLPKRHERRPRFRGTREACHEFVPQLSGQGSLPLENESASSPAIEISLHSIGGFAAVSATAIASNLTGTSVPTVYCTEAVEHNGLNAYFGTTVRCLATEPDATVVRIAVRDRGEEVAYETCMLARLRGGYRVFRLRDPKLGTRIDLCFVFVRISFGSEVNDWPTAAEVRRRVMELQKEKENRKQLEKQVDKFVSRLRRRSTETETDHNGALLHIADAGQGEGGGGSEHDSSGSFTANCFTKGRAGSFTANSVE